MKQDYQRELDAQKTKIEEEKINEVLRIKKEFLEILEGRNNALTTAEGNYDCLTKTHQETTEENRKLKLDNWSLKQKQSNSNKKYTIVYLAGVETGVVVDHYIMPALQELFSHPHVEPRKNSTTATPVTPIPKEVVLEPDIHPIHNGITPETTSSSILCSGLFSQMYGETHDTGTNAIPNLPDDVIHSPIYSINSGVDLITNISGSQCSGTFVSSHLENIPLQDTNTIQASPSRLIPSYSYMPLTPPNDPSESLLMQQIWMTDGKPFEVHIGKFFTYLDYQVTYTKPGGDYGADLVIERDGVRTVVSCRQRKENTGVDVVQAVHSAKEVYNAPHALIICTSGIHQIRIKSSENT
jgi:hypothetical protein